MAAILADDIFLHILFVPKGLVENTRALIQVMANNWSMLTHFTDE